MSGFCSVHFAHTAQPHQSQKIAPQFSGSARPPPPIQAKLDNVYKNQGTFGLVNFDSL